jgi:MFS family permease
VRREGWEKADMGRLSRPRRVPITWGFVAASYGLGVTAFAASHFLATGETGGFIKSLLTALLLALPWPLTWLILRRFVRMRQWYVGLAVGLVAPVLMIAWSSFCMLGYVWAVVIGGGGSAWIVVALSLLNGLLATWFELRDEQLLVWRDPGPVCEQCGYSAYGIISDSCPQCGWTEGPPCR